jgi:hypothetical protein
MRVFKARRKKISPQAYLEFFCQESIRGTVSYNDLAAKISCTVDTSASRQAFFYRTKEEAVEFFKQVLAAIIRDKHQLRDIDTTAQGLLVKRILIQDSTIIRLPDKLYEIFSGVKNALSTVCNARIQGVYDLLSGRFVSFSIDTYSENDLTVAEKIDVLDGDLVLRDRGYFTLSAIDKMKKQGANSISRYKHKTKFCDPDSLEEIDLLKRLQLSGSLDITVVSGAHKDIKVRILAAPVPEEVANIRRMRAKKEAKNRGCSYELLQLLGWTIFITTIEDSAFTMQQAAQLYALRWRIESIFKTWKSHLGFDKVHDVSQLQLRVILHARFIMITLLYEKLHEPLKKAVLSKHGKQLSLIKFMRYISRNLIEFIEQYIDEKRTDRAIGKVARYCTYEERRRSNFVDLMELNGLT